MIGPFRVFWDCPHCRPKLIRLIEEHGGKRVTVPTLERLATWYRYLRVVELKARQLTNAVICERMGIARKTIYRALRSANSGSK